MRRIIRLAIPLLRQPNVAVPGWRTYTVLQRPLQLVSRSPNGFRRWYSAEIATSKACPSCGSALEMREISCGKCGSLSPLPENVNYLSLFNFPSQEPFEFDIDRGKLRKEFLKMMTQVHPDSVINKADVPPFSNTYSRTKNVLQIMSPQQ